MNFKNTCNSQNIIFLHMDMQCAIPFLFCFYNIVPSVNKLGHRFLFIDRIAIKTHVFYLFGYF